ncbi:helix-turn-helix domain-containing protein [Paenibacillus chitinolyticus]|uniref:helix-turn-helix domain-containing protein n=1 Tax=Paenibacillus chitinolyticus TaxID=79263 RepID=UPI00386F2B1A
MYRVLIVDDEKYAVKGIVEGIDWKALGVDELYEAYHVPGAKEILLSVPIDLMITDIEMPKETGLDLLEWVREEKLEPETLILTCHADFGFARRAVQLGSRDYLLKPVMFEELEAVLAALLDRVRKKRTETEETERFKKVYRLWQHQKPQLISQFWREVMNRGSEGKQARLEQAIQAYELPPVHKEQLLLILLSVEEWARPFSAFDEELMEYALRKAAEETIVDERSGHVIEDEFGNNVVILYIPDKAGYDPAEWKKRCENYIQACRTYFSCRLSCYIGEVGPFGEVNKGYHALLEMETHNLSESNAVFFYEDRRQSGEEDGPLSFFHWTEELENGDEERLARLTEETFEWVRARHGKTEALSRVYHGVLQVVYYVLLRKGLSPDTLHGRGLPAGPAEITRSPGHLRDWLERVVRIVAELRGEPQEERRSNYIVQTIRTYIADHLDQELTRDELAAHVYLNAAYLSRLFRKETGMSLFDYILHERMKKAAQLLTSTEETVSAIANTLGYGNFSYFAKMFKKIYGETPQEYRKARS